MTVRSLLLIALLSVNLLAASSIGAAEKPDPMVLGDCLVIGRVASAGRSAVHRDAVEAMLVAGRWQEPKPGDKLTVGDRTSVWESAKGDKNGNLNHPALGGGYVYWKVPADVDHVAILEAAGHSMAYVNGEPRTGDPYHNGIVHLPVLLRKGTNEFLFAGGRGGLSARLVAPAASVQIDSADATLPDVRPDSKSPLLATVVILNNETASRSDLTLHAKVGDQSTDTPLPTLLPTSTYKARFSVPLPKTLPATATELPVDLELRAGDKVLFTKSITLRIQKPDETYKQTFISDIDGSVQYYAVRPAAPAEKGSPRPGLVLSLHGASVEGLGQASCYRARTWNHVVAPTNRRPYGFDWEDWGRLDALEVLAHAQQSLDTDRRRTWLTGHSMGGHGTWQLGVTFPDRFAAIAPSAGWVSFDSYAGGSPRPTDPTPIQAMLRRASSPSDTLSLSRNLAVDGVYVLHGDADDNVPVDQARTMRRVLADFHSDFSYYERPGAGHWWGNDCVDWPPLFDFLERHTLPKPTDVRAVDFTTASPGVSPRCHWASVEAQTHPLQPSTVHLKLDPEHRTVTGSTENVSRLVLDLAAFTGSTPWTVDLDGVKIAAVKPQGDDARLTFRRDDKQWKVIPPAPLALKGPHRYGPFKDAFRNRVLFVYGTKGSAAENAWALAKAKYDAETFWYRGNGAIEIIADTAFDAAKDPDRNVILYGNADGNAAWPKLLGESPVQVKTGVIRVGDREEKGDDLACVFVRPRPGSDRASVGAVSGSGLAGMRLTERLAYFLSGSGFPDLLILGPELLQEGLRGVRTAGFFGEDWGVATGDFAWKKP